VNSDTVQLVADLGEFNALEDEWRALVTRARLTLPFRTFDWNAAWWRAFAEDRSGVRDELAVRVVRDAGGTLVGIAPLVLTSRPARGPFRARALQFFGADPNITEIRGLVCAPAEEARVARALCGNLRTHCSEWDWIVWGGIQPDSDAALEIMRHRSVQWTRTIPDYVLPLPSSFDQLRAGLPRNLKESLRKCYNSLRRDGLEFDFVAVGEWSEAQAELSTFLDLHARRASAARTIRHVDVFQSAAAKRFLFDVCRRFAERDCLRVFVLRVGGRTVAVRIGFLSLDSLYLYYSGYDPEWGSYSVMTTCVAEAIRWATANELTTVNLSTGTDVSKTRWRPTEIVYGEAVQLAPRASANVNRLLLRSCETLLSSAPIQQAIRRALGRREATTCE
jgi:CelD/BcsL family acetyltransferase involved in cellulose biosynthesis